MQGRLYPSYAFAKYSGKKQGVESQWTNFSGVFSVSMNRPMLEALVDAIDAGVPEGECYSDEAADLVEGLESVLNGDAIRSTPLFTMSRMDEIYLISFTCTGLKVFFEAVQAGADFNACNGKSLFAFVAQSKTLYYGSERQDGEEAVPQGYTPRKRMRQSELQPVG